MTTCQIVDSTVANLGEMRRRGEAVGRFLARPHVVSRPNKWTLVGFNCIALNNSELGVDLAMKTQ